MIDVACAIIRNEDDEILIVQRGEDTDHPLKWEFPGGKLNTGESAEECIIREIREELAIDIVIFKRMDNVEYDYGIKRICLIPFICDTLDEIPFLSEHVAYKWLEKSELMTYDYSEADQIVAGQFLRYADGSYHHEVAEEPTHNDEIVDDDELQKMVNHILRLKEVDWLATSAVENRAIFLKLLGYSYSADKQLAFRSSWILTKICDKNPVIIYPHLPAVIDSLGKIENESVLRSFLRILSLTDLSVIASKQQGILADLCFNQLKSAFSSVAVKAYSMEIVYKLSLIYPELANELTGILRLLLEDSSGGILARGRMILKRLSERSIDQ